MQQEENKEATSERRERKQARFSPAQGKKQREKNRFLKWLGLPLCKGADGSQLAFPPGELPTPCAIAARSIANEQRVPESRFASAGSVRTALRTVLTGRGKAADALFAN